MRRESRFRAGWFFESPGYRGQFASHELERVAAEQKMRTERLRQNRPGRRSQRQALALPGWQSTSVCEKSFPLNKRGSCSAFDKA